MSLSIGTLTGYIGLEGVEEAEGRLGGLTEKIKGHGSKWGTLLGGAGLAGGALFGASLAGAINLEPGRDKIAAALDLTKTQAEVAGKVAGDVYANGWGESSEEVNDAVEAIMSSIKGMKNASASDLQAVTQDAMAFATAMGVDVGRAAQVAGNMIANGLAKNAPQAFDLLTKASSKVPKELREDVLDATDEYGQFFTALGIDGPAAMGLLAQGAQKGMYGIDKAGDAVKEFTIRATDMSKSTKQAIEDTGLDWKEVTDDLLAGGDTASKAFQQVIDGLLNIKDPAARSQAALSLFGTPLEDLGVKDIPKFLKSLKTGQTGLGNWEGAAKRAGDTLSGNTSSNIQTFTRHIQMAFIDVLGNKVLPIVTDMTGKLNTGLGPALSAVGGVLQTVTGFLSEHQGVAIGLTAVIAALVAVTLAHQAVLAVTAAGGMVQWLKGTKLISSATKVWTAVQWAMNAAMTANPIGLLVVAIALLIGAVVLVATKTEWGRKAMTRAWNAVKDAGRAVGLFFRDTVPGWFTAAWTKIKDGASSVVDWITGIPNKIGALGGKFGKAGKDLLQGFIDGMKNAAGVISGIAGNVWDAVRGLLNGAIDKINTALEFRIDKGPVHIGVNPTDIPHLRTGGRTKANAPGMAWIGDANEPESVLRDSQLKALLREAVAQGVGRDNNTRSGGPLVGQVVQQPGESAEVLAERLWFLTRKRG